MVAWNNFAWLATQDATFVSGSGRINSEAQKGGQPPIVQILRRQGSLRAITTFQIHLRMYTENFKVVEDAAKAGIPFTDLTAGELVALMFAYQFEFAEADAMGENLAQSLATPAFEQTLNRLAQAMASAIGRPVALEGGLETGALVTAASNIAQRIKTE